MQEAHPVVVIGGRTGNAAGDVPQLLPLVAEVAVAVHILVVTVGKPAF